LWAGGPKAEALLTQDPGTLTSRALQTVAETLKVDLPRVEGTLVKHYFHDWSRDPLALGAYSYTPVNSWEARKVLAEPVKGTLFFAGEATNTAGAHGTVHGAIQSGLSSAKGIS
jgi:monoamine oxidase